MHNFHGVRTLLRCCNDAKLENLFWQFVRRTGKKVGTAYTIFSGDEWHMLATEMLDEK
jgi:hypothetical protein